MAKNTSMTLGDHFEEFIAGQVASGRYRNTSEVVRAGLRLLEEREQKVVALQRTLDEGASSGDAGELDFAKIRAEARRRNGLTPARD